MNNVYEPAPCPWCEHQWMNVGLPVITYASNSTMDEPPKEAPVTQKRQCLLCHGVQDFAHLIED